MDLKTAKASMETAQQRQQHYANQHRQHIQFELGDLVMISTHDMKMRTLAARFKQRWIGQYPVTHGTGAVIYRICLPPNLKRLHPMFHMSKLKAHKTSPLNPPVIAPPVDQDLNDDVEYPIKEILESRAFGRAQIPQYNVMWASPYGHDEWLPATDQEECTSVDSFLARQGEKEANELIKRRRSPRIANIPPIAQLP
jgi:hypothetical protein